jgi:hypothetical protein
VVGADAGQLVGDPLRSPSDVSATVGIGADRRDAEKLVQAFEMLVGVVSEVGKGSIEVAHAAIIRGAMEPIVPTPRPRRMLRRLLAVTALSSLVSVAAPVSHVLACSCVQLGAGDALANAEVAWVGVVTAVDDPQTGQAAMQDPVHYTFAVEESLKGTLGTSIDVSSARSGASCGQEFALAQRWKVFAFADDQGHLQTGLCSGNELLGERVSVAGSSTSPLPGLLLAIGGVAVLVAFSAWVFMRRPRGRSA